MTKNIYVLIPYDPAEGMDLQNAARRAGRSVETIKTWCKEYGLGRKIGGQWIVSKPALEMYLDGNMTALGSYHAGQMTEVVQSYFARVSVSLRRACA